MRWETRKRLDTRAVHLGLAQSPSERLRYKIVKKESKLYPIMIDGVRITFSFFAVVDAVNAFGTVNR